MRAEFDAAELKSVAGTFKMMQDASRSIPLFGAAHYLDDGRVMFVGDVQCGGAHPMSHVKFILKPIHVGNFHERRSAYFSLSEFVSAVSSANASSPVVFEILPNGDLEMGVGGLTFHLKSCEENTGSLLWVGDGPNSRVGSGEIVTVPHNVSGLHVLDELVVDGLQRAFKFVIPAVDLDIYVTRGRMLLEFHGHGCFRLVGTDGRRVHFADVGMCGRKMVEKEKTVLIDPKGAKMMEQAFSILRRKFPPPTPLKVQVSRGVMSYSDNDDERFQYACAEFMDTEKRVALYIAFSDVRWIDYNSLNHLLYADDLFSVRLGKDAAKAARKFFTSSAKAGKRGDIVPVGFHCFSGSNRILLSLDYNGVRAQEEIESLSTNQRGFTVYMNAKMTADALSFVRSDECVFMFKGDDRLDANPYSIRHKDEVCEYCSLIAPMDSEKVRKG